MLQEWLCLPWTMPRICRKEMVPILLLWQVESLPSRYLRFVHNIPPFLPHHSFMVLVERGIKCHFYIPIPTCLQFPGLGTVLPPKALQSPQLISRKVHKNMAPKILALTTPSPTRKKRVVRKKPEIVELDDDVELLKTGHHWKDHWVIHLISLPGEMQNTFNSPPKQGVFLFYFLFLPFVFSLFRVWVVGGTLIPSLQHCPTHGVMHIYYFIFYFFLTTFAISFCPFIINPLSIMWLSLKPL